MMVKAIQKVSVGQQGFFVRLLSLAEVRPGAYAVEGPDPQHHSDEVSVSEPSKFFKKEL